jgi:hypothetical protein
MMNDTPTPITNRAVADSNGQWSFVLRNCSQQLERELTAVTEQRDMLAEVLRNIMAYRKGEKPYDYWRLPFEERENAAFGVRMQIENSINQALQSLNQNEP